MTGGVLVTPARPVLRLFTRRRLPIGWRRSKVGRPRRLMPKLDYEARPSDPAYERWRWQIFAITWLAYAGFYFTRKSFAVAKIGLQRDPSIRMTDTQMAWIDMANLAAYAVGQFLFGIAGDKAGPRRIVLAGMVGSVAAAVAMGASHFVVIIGVMYCIQGLCQ